MTAKAGFDRGVPLPTVRAAELRGAQAFRWRWPRSFLERVEDPIPKAIYEARLRGFDRAAEAAAAARVPLSLFVARPDDWWKLPMAFRERWWAETDFSRKPPSAELERAIEEALARRLELEMELTLRYGSGESRDADG